KWAWLSWTALSPMAASLARGTLAAPDHRLQAQPERAYRTGAASRLAARAGQPRALEGGRHAVRVVERSAVAREQRGHHRRHSTGSRRRRYPIGSTGPREVALSGRSDSARSACCVCRQSCHSSVPSCVELTTISGPIGRARSELRSSPVSPYVVSAAAAAAAALPPTASLRRLPQPKRGRPRTPTGAVIGSLGDARTTATIAATCSARRAQSAHRARCTSRILLSNCDSSPLGSNAAHMRARSHAIGLISLITWLDGGHRPRLAGSEETVSIIDGDADREQHDADRDHHDREVDRLEQLVQRRAPEPPSERQRRVLVHAAEGAAVPGEQAEHADEAAEEVEAERDGALQPRAGGESE